MSIECKRCHSKFSSVTNSYRKDGTYKGKQISVIRRRRECQHCGYCWFTNEHFEDLDDWEGSKLLTKKEDKEKQTDKEPSKLKKKSGNKSKKDPPNPYLTNED